MVLAVTLLFREQFVKLYGMRTNNFVMILVMMRKRRTRVGGGAVNKRFAHNNGGVK